MLINYPSLARVYAGLRGSGKGLSVNGTPGGHERGAVLPVVVVVVVVSHIGQMICMI